MSDKIGTQKRLGSLRLMRCAQLARFGQHSRSVGWLLCLKTNGNKGDHSRYERDRTTFSSGLNLQRPRKKIRGGS